MNNERDREIEQLTGELFALTLRTQRITEQLQRLRSERNDETTNNERNETTNNEQRGGPYQSGDRVQIINKVRRPADWPTDWNQATIEAERRATVTRTVKNQVWIRTDNGTETWRARNNLRPLR